MSLSEAPTSTVSHADWSLVTGLKPFRKIVVKSKIKTSQPHSFHYGKKDS